MMQVPAQKETLSGARKEGALRTDGRGRTHFKKRILRAATLPDTVVSSGVNMGDSASGANHSNNKTMQKGQKRKMAEGDERKQEGGASGERIVNFAAAFFLVEKVSHCGSAE